MKRLNKYNDVSIEAIKKFIDNFFSVFPKLLSENELIERIVFNLEKNIEFDCNLDNMGGFYNPNEKKICISIDSTDKERTLFHEFIHVITYSNFLEKIEYRNFVEGLTSLAEEKYFNYKKSPDRINRVNNYMYEFVKQLDFVSNGELLEQFLINPDNVYKVFLYNNILFDINDIDEDDYKKKFELFCELNDKVIEEYNDEYCDTEIYNSVISIEDMILEQYYLRVAIGKEKFDLNKLIDLYYRQIYPNIDSFFAFVDNMIKMNEISENDLIKYNVFYNSYLLYKNNMDIDEFKNIKFGVREIEWIAAKIFGYSCFIDSDVYIGDFGCDLDMNISINDLPKMEEFYKNNVPVYTKLIEFILDDNINIDDIINCNLRVGGNVKSSTYVKNILDEGNWYYRYYNIGKFSCDSKIDYFILEEDNNIKYVFDEKNIYFSIDYYSLIWKIRSSNIFDSLHEFFIRYEDSDCIYVNCNFRDDILDNDNCQVVFYVLKDGELYKISMVIKDNIFYEDINKVDLSEDFNKLFIVNLKEKTMCK